MELPNAEQSHGTGWPDGPVYLRRTVTREPWAGAGAQHVSFRIRRRVALRTGRHDLLRVDASGRGARGADARDAEDGAFQQAADVRVSQAILAQSERAASL